MKLLSNPGRSLSVSPPLTTMDLDDGRETVHVDSAFQCKGRPKLTPLTVAELVKAYEAGATVRELVFQFGMHRATVLAHLERQGVPRRPQLRKLPDDQVAEAAALYTAGLSLADVGRRLDVSAGTVRKELLHAGVSVRPRMGRN
jgi:lambda repressor-like predicted transcriptional regulator